MIRGLESVLLSSENPKKLAEFYQDKVGVKIKEEYEMGEGESLFEMEIPEGSGFTIISHSEVKGKAKEPQRFILNFEVADIDKAISEIESKDVKTIAEKYHVEGYGYIATFEDIDGNYFQLVQVRENK